MPSMAAQGYRKLGANGCRGASWIEQFGGKELRGALAERDRNGEDSRFLDTVYMASPPFIYYSEVC